MQAKQLADIRPFEICSIRPPTENYSLTFRLLRNCYWKKCGFCPLYKTGAKFRKRPVQEVKEDISNGDADALILKPEYIQEVMSHIRENFPGFVKSRLMP